jgi:hypothetical protein
MGKFHGCAPMLHNYTSNRLSYRKDATKNAAKNRTQTKIHAGKNPTFFPEKRQFCTILHADL